MKINFYLLLLISILFGACKKDSSTKSEIYVEFINSRYGPKSINSDGTVSGAPSFFIFNATGKPYTYTIEGSNGLKPGKTEVAGSGTVSSPYPLIPQNVDYFYNYNDGLITVKVTIDNKVYTAQAQKEEFKVRTFDDLTTIASSNDLCKNNYEQVADIMWPQTRNHLFIYPFSGTYDGKGYKIYNVSLNIVDAAPSIFSIISQTGVIKNLIIEYNENGLINNGLGNDAGGLVGRCEGKIINCSVRGNLGNVAEASSIGGIVGELQPGGQIIGCTYIGSITANNSGNYGGIVGLVTNSTTPSEAMILYSYSQGSFIRTSNGSTAFTAGIAGLIYNKVPTIQHCYSNMSLAANQYARGIANFYITDNMANQITDCHTLFPENDNNMNVTVHPSIDALKNTVLGISLDPAQYPAGFQLPSNGKAYKANPDITKGPFLWWEK